MLETKRVAAAGRVEILSSDFVLGWIEIPEPALSMAYATLDNQVIGFAKVDIQRSDLNKAAADGVLQCAAASFLIVFDKPVPDDRVGDVRVYRAGYSEVLTKTKTARLDRKPKLQIFVFGSPRSGTSELGNTLASQLKLPWLGEGHAAPFFAAAVNSLTSPYVSDNGLIRFMREQDYRGLITEAAKRAYFYAHGSASFVDKTPGVPMISAAPFISECFPEAKMIYLRRNGISNVLSRMVKFGGSFDGHCADWAAALNEWARIRDLLPNYLELQQEEMLNEPESVAARLAEYLQVSDAVTIAAALKSGSRERTGAGVGKVTFAETGWSPEQIARFQKICGPTMETFGYTAS